MPDELPAAAAQIPGELAADITDVERELAAFDAQQKQTHDFEQLARFLLRAEAVASSRIEGLEVSSRRLARHAAGHRGQDATADAVLGNVAAMQLAVGQVAQTDRIEVEHLLQIHAALMEKSSTPQLAGLVRTTQNWIGGNRFNPCGAAFVPPPPERVPGLLADLCEFMNQDNLPGILQAAIVHAQFETIHPFADGNGRTGRALIHVIFRRRAVVTGFVPPVSLALATDTKAYIAGLTAYRYDGPPDGANAALGLRQWVDIFVAATRRATRDAEALRVSLHALEARWREKLRPRRNSAADKLLPVLVANPVLGVDDVVRLAQVSESAAYLAVDQIVAAGILAPVSKSSRNRLFEAPDMFQVLTDYERASATESGDTHEEKPPSRSVSMRGNGLRVERLVKADAGQLLTLQRAAYVSEARLYGDPELPALTQTLPELVAELRTLLGLKAVAGSRMVGAVRARVAGDTIHIGRLVVAPDQQGRGIGSDLLARVEALAPAAVRTAALFTGHLSEANLRLYIRSGYREVSREQLRPGVVLVHLDKSL